MPTALLVGASRGLGLGLARELLGRSWQVIATERRPSGGLAGLGSDRLRVLQADIDRAEDVASLGREIAGTTLDLLFVVAGVSGSVEAPIHEVPVEEAARVFTTNALSPLRAVEALEPLVAPGGVIAVMTSRLGSVELATTGSWETYRASKAALNMLTRCFAVRHRDRIVLAMHPGWVRTDMGGPNATLDLETSVRGMADVIEARRGGAPGDAYVAYDGAVLPW